jgi:hypothetical protein
MSPSWQPAWVTEKRSPAFVTGADEPDHIAFGNLGMFGGNYLWGNIPAINCLQVARNEGERAPSMDFKLCFAGEPSS